MTKTAAMDNLNKQLLEAAEKGNTDACREDAQAVDKIGWSALYVAAGSGHLDTCQLLLARGADVQAVNQNGWSALHLAASNGHADVCQLLLDCGASVHAVDNDGWDALHMAAQWGRTDICFMLLEHGGDPLLKNGIGNTALDMAIEKKHENCASVMRAWIAANAARTALRDICPGSDASGAHPSVW